MFSFRSVLSLLITVIGPPIRFISGKAADEFDKNELEAGKSISSSKFYLLDEPFNRLVPFAYLTDHPAFEFLKQYGLLPPHNDERVRAGFHSLTNWRVPMENR
jgi:hypothetical protein